jgi:SAM-dependent methyltransferase
MDEKEIYLFSLVEKEHFFYRTRRDLVRFWLEKFFAGKKRPVVIDTGSGTGIMVSELGENCDAFGSDLFFNPKISLPVNRFVRANVSLLPFADNTADATIALDLLEHLPDDLAGLKEIASITRPGGYLLINVPAFPLLWSDWDQAVGHKRRYKKQTFQSLADKAGLDVVFMHYANSLPFFPILIYRWFRSTLGVGKKQRLEDRMPPRLINRALSWAFFQEGSKNWASIPFGSSLFAVLRKKSGNN